MARLVGSNTNGVSVRPDDYVYLAKFTAIATGNAVEIRVYSLASGNVKVAIYADLAGTPAALLRANNTGQAVTLNQWNTLTIPSTEILTGTVYWVGTICDTDDALSYAGTAGTSLIKNIAYAGFTFPDPYPGAYSPSTVYMSQAAWGESTPADKWVEHPDIDVTTGIAVAMAMVF